MKLFPRLLKFGPCNRKIISELANIGFRNSPTTMLMALFLSHSIELFLKEFQVVLKINNLLFLRVNIRIVHGTNAPQRSHKTCQEKH